MEALLAAAPAEAGLVRDVRELNEALGQRYAGRLDAPRAGADAADAGADTGARAHRASRFRTPVGAAGRGHPGRGSGGSRRLPRARSHDGRAQAGGRVRHHRDRRAQRVRAGGAPSRGGGGRRGGPSGAVADQAHRRQRARARAVAVWAGSWWAAACCPTAACRRPSSCTRTAPAAASRSTCARSPGLDNTAFRFAERDGFGAFYWVDRPLAYAIAGRLSREELMSLANAVYGQLELR